MYYVKIKIENPTTGEVVSIDTHDFEDEFVREMVCWEIDHVMDNKWIGYTISEEDWKIDGRLCYIKR